MNKRITFLSLILTVFFAGNSCKKENNNPKSAYAGKYVLVSETNVNMDTGVSETYTSTASPCMSDNQTTLKDDGTWAAAYVGAEDCYVSRTPNSITIIGSKGESTAGNWAISTGNRIKFTLSDQSTSYGQLNNVGGKVQLTFKDTSQNYISTSVLVKQ
ncbi:hypothetical protein ACFFGT_25195 [Mucilaginibacter angelicae]|uniref:Lipocalin-like domain-containing protein n=1 Tax=Mucilaginibacter angelicae TaxID=869718 RepID=A0ABV6LDL4_9SPHI